MSKKPNFLIIMTDQQRADTAGLPVHPVRAPRLRGLAAEGIRFTNTFCTSPHCCPSRASFFSGLWPSGHGIWNNVLNNMAVSKDLNEGVSLFSEDLAEAGYENHYFGKWHVSGKENPEDRGWIPHTVSARTTDFHGSYWSEYEALAQSGPSPRKAGEIATPGYLTMPLFRDLESDRGGHDRLVVDEVLSELDRLSEARGPWCLYAGLFYPHDPYEVPQAYLDRFPLEEIVLPASAGDEMADKPAAYRMIREKTFSQMDEQEKRDALRHYYALCAYVDDQVGMMLDKLEVKGLAEDTVVIFTSDHGDYCGEHGLFCKGVPPFDSAYKVPLIVRLPEAMRTAGSGGQERGELISLADIAPTILDLAGISYKPERFHGHSLVSFLRGKEEKDWRDAVYMQTNGVELYYCQRIIRTETHKLVFNGYDLEEVYDLKRDPGEVKNLARDPHSAALKERLYRKLWKAAFAVGDGMTNGYFTVRMAGQGPAAAFLQD